MRRTATSFRTVRRQQGFTLIELIVVLAILGILIALAIPRYLGTQRTALVAEGNNTLQEMKTLAWAYYVQYGTWSGIDTTALSSAFGFTPPAGSCWSFATPGGQPDSIQLTATAPGPSPRSACGILTAGSTITLTLNGDGSATRSESL